MIAKEYLNQAYLIDQRINSKLEQVKSLRDFATRATSSLTDLPHKEGRNVHQLEDIIVKILDYEAEINSDISKLVDTKREITKRLQEIHTIEHRILLELRYICCKTWEEIATEMSYSVRNIHILHSAALREVGKTIGEK